MTDEEKLTMLQNLTGETDPDTLSTYLFLAKGKVIAHAYPFGGAEEIPSKYDSVHVEIAAYMLNKRGAEGETAHSENGVNRTYGDADIPLSLLPKSHTNSLSGTFKYASGTRCCWRFSKTYQINEGAGRAYSYC